MRLLKIDASGGLSLVERVGSSIPPYAILSHAWGADKDSAELAEAINSFFRWYEKAARCYVYLSDVSSQTLSEGDSEHSRRWKPELRRSKWFTRGWTLQELIAPASVEFFSAEEERLGDKQTLEQTLHEITGMPVLALRKTPLSHFTVGERMSWAAKRQTKREEDETYCLLGIFDIQMPLLYGEGRLRASFRIRREIESWNKEPFLHSSNPTAPTFQNYPATAESMAATDSSKSPAEMIKSWKELLDLLFFEHIDERLLSLKSAHHRTCKWFLHTEQYKDWINGEQLHAHRGFLWIKGKPGAGKSTLMKFLDAKAKAAAKPDPSSLVTSFFFNARGEDLEKSTEGLYRSLLWQLFQVAPDLQIILDEFATITQRVVRNKGWQLEILKHIFAKAVERLGCRNLQLYIDALDECNDEDVADMISFFEELGDQAVEANVKFRICFSSRHYPTVTIQWGKQLTLEDEKEHEADITRYINSTLKLSNQKKASSLKSQILEKSAGVFLWVALVMPMLNKASARGRIEELQDCLNGIPPGLDNLFEMMLTRDREDMQELRSCVQWILFAKRPLKQEEYFFAIRSANAPGLIECWAAGDVSDEDMQLFVHSSSKGLAQLTKTRSTEKTPTVQFIHESVRDFFLAKKGHLRLWPALEHSLASCSHEAMKDRCLTEINVRDVGNIVPTLAQPLTRLHPSVFLQRDVVMLEHIHGAFPKANSSEASALRAAISGKFPFLEYAIQHVLRHGDAVRNNATDQTRFLEDLRLKYWILLDNLFERFQVRRHTLDASLLYILAEKNLPALIKCQLKRVPNMDVRGERYQFPMFAACVNGNKEAIAALLMQEDVPGRNSKLASQMDRLAEYRPQKGEIPVIHAVERDDLDIVDLLLRTGKVDFNTDYRNNHTLLTWASSYGHESIARTLLDTGQIDVNARDNRGQTPLSWALVAKIDLGNRVQNTIAIIELLKFHGATE